MITFHQQGDSKKDFMREDFKMNEIMIDNPNHLRISVNLQDELFE